MSENQNFQIAQLMFLQGSGRKDVIDSLRKNGVAEERLEGMATEAYLSIKDQRQNMIEETYEEESGGGAGSIILGAVFLIGGVAATMGTDRIWYGAMIVGALMVFRGLAKSF